MDKVINHFKITQWEIIIIKKNTLYMGWGKEDITWILWINDSRL